MLILNIFRIVALGIVLAGAVGRIPSTQPDAFYVSPSGDDSHPGTIEQPFRTLEQARNAVRGIGPALTADINVVLRGGTHARSETLTLDSRDGGRTGFKVIYRNYPGETPVVSGGQIIGGWIKEGDLWKAQVGPGRETRQFYVGGVRATRARSGEALAGAQPTPAGFRVADASLQHWAHIQDAEVVINSLWRQFRCGVDSLAGTALTLDQPCWSLVNREFSVRASDPAYLENAFELLDTPGEWYLNPRTGWLHYWPRPGEDMTKAEAVVPVVETLMRVGGAPSDPIRNLTFEGIVFAYAGWTRPSNAEGFAEYQANWHRTASAITRLPAAVDVTDSESVTFDRNTFTHLGAGGLSLGKSTADAIVTGNRFFDISGTGLMLGSTDNAKTTDAREIPRRNLLSNNYIHHVALEYMGGIGLWIGYAQHTLVAHNELHSLPYTAISIGWGWGKEEPTVARDNRIEANLIYNHVEALDDGGGVYSLGAQPGNVYARNVIREQYAEYGAMYLDNGARYITVRDNVIFGNKRSALIKGRAQGADHYIHDNWWQERYSVDIWHFTDDDPDSYPVGEPGPNRIENNRHIESLTDAPAAILAAAGIEARYRDIRDGDPVPSPTPRGSVQSPIAASHLRAVRTATGDRAALSWNPVTHALSYRLQIENLTTGVRQVEATVGVPAYSHELVAGHRYRFAVRGIRPPFDDGALATSASYSFGRPELTPIAAQTTAENTPTSVVSFAIRGLDGSADNVTLTAVSSDAALIPASNILLGGSGADRTVTVTPATNRSGSAAVTVTVSDGIASASQSFLLTVVAPAVAIDRAGLAFAATCGVSECTGRTPSQTVRVTQSGPGLVTWTASPSLPWLRVTPSSGRSPGQFAVEVDLAAGPPAAPSLATIDVSFTNARTASAQVAVEFAALDDGMSQAPVGRIDTPIDGTADVTGSIAVTGWAVDDVGVSAVRLYRDPTGAESAQSLVFLGEATRVEGARPDVASAFPSSPDVTRAGWGYLLLTNVLPNRGDGIFRIHAVATDVEGHTTPLGTVAITCVNERDTAPFGAIDTPAQGQTVSGIVDNFGWVLARGARRVDPPHGGSVKVVIDGQPIGSPSGWVARADLTGLFPLTEYSGVSSALGVFRFDSTMLSDGVHTIAWLVMDDEGNLAAIGSRYFTVANGGR